jgi:hypothetical protein
MGFGRASYGILVVLERSKSTQRPAAEGGTAPMVRQDPIWASGTRSTRRGPTLEDLKRARVVTTQKGSFSATKL